MLPEAGFMVDDDAPGYAAALAAAAGDIGFMLCVDVAADAGFVDAELPPAPLLEFFEQPASATAAAMARGTAYIIFI